MSRNDPPPLFGVVLRHLRQTARGWTQRRLEKEAGLPASRISKLERGTYGLDRPTLEELVAALGFPAAAIDQAIAAFEQAPGGRAAGEAPGALTPAEDREVEALSSELARTVASIARRKMTAVLIARRVLREREEAGRLWAHLRRQQPAELQRDLVGGGVERYQTWALSERLCAESVLAAADDAERALHLAGLALLAAERSPGKEKHRRRREGYAWGFFGNARRVAGDLPEAERGFLRAEELWKAGEASPAEPLDASRRLDLLASLRRQQGREPEGLELLEEAFQIAVSPERKKRIALKRSMVLSRLEKYDEALGELERLALRFDERKPDDLRLRWLVEFNWTSNLWHLARFPEAQERLVRNVQPLTLELGNGLDRLRVRWLEARVAEGLGRRDEAAAGLREVWHAFADRQILFDAGLAVLELAALELERGRTREVKILASDAAAIFAAQAIPSELLASVQLFWQAARREAATAAAARHLLAELRRAGPLRDSS